MSDLDALLAAVLNAPEDDTPRLVYADALEETGEWSNVARAEFIRLSIADEGHDRRRELMRAWGKGWVPQHGRLTPPEHLDGDWWSADAGVAVELARGFVSAVRLSDPLDRWSEDSPGWVADRHGNTVSRLFAAHPLERVVIDFNTGHAETWTVGRAAGGPWTAGMSFAAAPLLSPRVAFTAADRATFADQLARTVRGRLFTLGLWVVAGQDGPF